MASVLGVVYGVVVVVEVVGVYDTVDGLLVSMALLQSSQAMPDYQELHHVYRRHQKHCFCYCYRCRSGQLFIMRLVFYRQ